MSDLHISGTLLGGTSAHTLSTKEAPAGHERRSAGTRGRCSPLSSLYAPGEYEPSVSLRGDRSKVSPEPDVQPPGGKRNHECRGKRGMTGEGGEGLHGDSARPIRKKMGSRTCSSGGMWGMSCNPQARNACNCMTPLCFGLR